MKDQQHPFLRPVYRRVILVAICFAWAGVELYMGSQTWALISAAIGVYGIWIFFVTYKPLDEPPADAGGPTER